MDVTIIGGGNMGRGIGYRMVAGGNSVIVIDQAAEASQALAEELANVAAAGARSSAATMDNVVLGDVVVLALQYGINKEVVRELGDRLADRIVIDIANPLNASFDGLETETGTSSAEEVAALVPPSTSVIKAFNTTFASTLVEGTVGGVPLDVFMAGNDPGAKKKVGDLIRAGGLTPIDAGDLARARELEAMGLIHISLQMIHNLGFGTTLKLIQPN